MIPLAAELTPANVNDGEEAPLLLRELPDDARYIWGDTAYNTPDIRQWCLDTGHWLVANQHGPYPHTGDGVAVRRVFHKLRSLGIENFNEHFKTIFDGHGQVPTKGMTATRQFALGAILVYQLALLYRFEHGLDLNAGLKAFLKAAL